MEGPQIRALRAADRQRAIQQATEYVQRLQTRLGPVTGILYGSYARGDFHAGSDIDVLILCEALPLHPLERLEVLYAEVQGDLEPKGYTPAEWEQMLERGHPAALEAQSQGVVLVDSLGLGEGKREEREGRMENGK